MASIDSAMEQLSKLLSGPGLNLAVKQKVQILQLELKFIKLFFTCLSKWNDVDQSTIAHLGSLQMDVAAAGQGIYEAGYFAILGIDARNWDLLASNMLEKVGFFKPEVRKICVDSVDCSLQSKPSSSADGILEFIDSILSTLKELAGLKGDCNIQVKKQIQVVEGKLRFLKNFHDFAAKYCYGHHLLEDFQIKVQSWANNAACLTLVYWVDGLDEVVEGPHPMNGMLQKIMPCNPEVVETYLELMKYSKSSQCDTLLQGKIVVGFVDFLLENPMDALEDYVEILREGLMFCLSFFMNPPMDSAQEVGNVLSGEINEIVAGLTRLVCSLNTDDKKEGSLLLLDFLQRIKNVQSEVRELYVQHPNSSESSFPNIIGMGLIDNLLDDLGMMKLKCEAKFIPFSMPKVGIIHKELMSWRPFLKDIVERQNEHQELKDLWRQILTVAYRGERVISSCLSADCHIWFDIVRLSNVLEEIKVISKQIQNMELPNVQMSPTSNQPSEGNTSKADEIVGLKDEANEIVHQLNTGTDRLHIVSIVGMPGVGKTTLAQKVYHDLSVQLHFSRHAWCFVSKVFRCRDLLLGILRSVTAMTDAQISSMNDDDLLDKLRKSLKGERYLIVMDNIWDIEAWEAIKDSLPDDNKRSRILVTSQNHNLASQTKLSYQNHPLSSLSDEKSWEFLKEKLFGHGPCSETLVDVGNQIARSCKGLPLAIVVIAGLLAKEKTNVEWWKQIRDNLGSLPDGEGYMKVLEISYRHLPNSLKPCFLYLGALGEGEVITVRKLATLWIAEGFVNRDKMKSSETEAKQNLIELINRSLVIVTKRSSKREIKACRVHDLLRKLCMEKAKEERLLHTLHMSDVSPDHFLNPVEYDQYRLCIYTEWGTLIRSIPTGSCARSFLLFGNSRWNQSYSDSVTSQFFHTFKFLKVLDMESIYLDCSFPEEIFLLVALRYLAIRGCITDIPSSVSSLWILETLIVRASGSSVRVPVTILKMKSLRHVDVSPRAVMSFRDFELEELPQLDNMESFSCLSLYHGEDTEKVLRKLSGIRRLRCVFLESPEYVWKGIQFPNLASLENLESLKVSTDASDRHVFHSWMRIQFHGFGLPASLKKLTLYGFGLPWKQMSLISQLENLKVLKLRDDAFRGKRWDVEDDEFQNLEYLELSNLNIEQWNISYDNFTSLERLVIGDCYGLEKIPSEFSARCTMKTIELRRCSENVRKSAMEILKEQRDDFSNPEFEVVQL